VEDNNKADHLPESSTQGMTNNNADHATVYSENTEEVNPAVVTLKEPMQKRGLDKEAYWQLVLRRAMGTLKLTTSKRPGPAVEESVVPVAIEPQLTVPEADAAMNEENRHHITQPDLGDISVIVEPDEVLNHLEERASIGSNQMLLVVTTENSSDIQTVTVLDGSEEPDQYGTNDTGRSALEASNEEMHEKTKQLNEMPNQPMAPASAATSSVFAVSTELNNN
jgi:hypothetical protein